MPVIEGDELNHDGRRQPQMQRTDFRLRIGLHWPSLPDSEMQVVAAQIILEKVGTGRIFFFNF
jgi:hypothetical protein